MKPRALTASGLLVLLACQAQAALVMIDFNNRNAGNTAPNDPTTTGNYNNFSISNTGVTAIGQVGTTLDLIDTDTGADGGWNLTLTKLNAAGGIGAAGTGADYAGPYPVVLNGFAQTALRDGIYLNNLAQLEVRFSNLDITQTYDLLGYTARGNNAGSATFNLTIGTLGSGGDGNPLTIHAFNDKATDTGVIDWRNITPDANGDIAFVITAPSNVANANAASLNFLALTQVPEPSATALLCGFAVLGLARRRR